MKEGLIRAEMIRQRVSDMKTVNICPVASSGTSEDVIQDYCNRLSLLLPDTGICWSACPPDAILFTTGGTEQKAVNLLREQNPVLLLAFEERNAFASACEVKAYLDHAGRKTRLINLSDPQDIARLADPDQTLIRLNSFLNSRIGIVGTESEWLIHSVPDPAILKERFGIDLIRLSWDQFPDSAQWPESDDFNTVFASSLTDQVKVHGRVFGLLHQIVHENRLDGITVECFPMVMQDRITACPALALLNQEGIPAASEGDLVSLVGMLLCKSLTGKIPWMANLSGIKNDQVHLSHCTVPFNLVSDYRFDTHYETGQGIAVCGTFYPGEYTLLRLSSDFRHAFVAEGSLIHHDPITESCRTQAVIKLPADRFSSLKNNPLGNHHLLLRGNFKDLLRTALINLNFTII